MDLHSGYPYWFLNDGLPFEYPKLEHSVKTDVAILGGGISGALTGYYLINEGIDCVVIDARTIGLGSTCASTVNIFFQRLQLYYRRKVHILMLIFLLISFTNTA